MKKIAVILSGCGHQDGTEITEAVSLIVGLTQNGAQISFFAPDMDIPVKNHITSKLSSENEHRNVLIESARIARGQIKDLRDLNIKEFDAVAFPGGYGAAVNLCDWGQKGASCNVRQDIKEIILGFHQASKPIGAVCIAPVLIAKVLGSRHVTITLGDSSEIAAEVAKTGAIHEICPVNDFVSDRENKVITSPAYMYGEAKPFEVFAGITALAKELVEMA